MEAALRSAPGPLQKVWDVRAQVAVGLILILAAVLRFVHVGDTPLPLSDEVFAAVDAHSVMVSGHHFDGSAATTLTYIVLLLDGRLFAFVLHGGPLGPSIGDLRLISAALGVGTVYLVILIGAELGDRALGIAAAAALAIMPWHIYFSRIFYPASEYVFLTSLALLLGLRALRKRSLLNAVGAAAAGVGAIYIYPVAIVSTPLLGGTLLVLGRAQLIRFGWLRAIGVAAMTIVLLTPYVAEHLTSTNAAIVGQNEVIQNELLWNHQLSPGDLVREFLTRWLSYQSLNFTIVQGDPIVRWSIQQMGDLGWALGVVGWIGVALALLRRDVVDKLLLSWLALYPIPDAVTYYDAAPNGVRGITGSVIWALLVASAVLAIRQVKGWRPRAGLATLLAAGLTIQVIAFSLIYFGSYNDRYAFAFETGYDQIYPILREHHLERDAVTIHAGYQRNIMLQYFSVYRLDAAEQILACYDLPFNVLHYTQLPRVFVVREDPDVQQQNGCIHAGLIDRDLSALRAVAPQRGEQPRKVDLIATFYDDVSHRYSTAILYVHY
ncbi:MAG TPA: hypothetical protein VJQ08_06585 [Candidatus Dormibacteraeota bacterium]|nr:hypothetical protein [Candidatus Dormibacteraeota bacterium]